MKLCVCFFFQIFLPYEKFLKLKKRMSFFFPFSPRSGALWLSTNRSSLVRFWYFLQNRTIFSTLYIKITHDEPLNFRYWQLVFYKFWEDTIIFLYGEQFNLNPKRTVHRKRKKWDSERNSVKFILVK